MEYKIPLGGSPLMNPRPEMSMHPVQTASDTTLVSCLVLASRTRDEGATILIDGGRLQT